MTSTEADFNPNRPDATVALTQAEQDVFHLLLEVAAGAGGEQAGVTLRVAGGWVRDKLLSKDSDDIDIAVDRGSGAAFAQLVAEHVGKQAGDVATIKANPDASKHLETATFKVRGIEMDFAALRSETYADSRIPDIRPGTPTEDAHRRDLTMNSLFYNIHTGLVEDWTGRGVDDLRRGAIVTPLEPYATFVDDPLRILRTVRFAARFNGRLDAAIEPAAKNPEVHQALEQKISKERLWVELWKMLRGPNPDYAVRLLRDLNLHSILFPAPPVDTLPPEHRVELVNRGVFGAAVVERLVEAGITEGLDKDTVGKLLLAALIAPLWPGVEASVGKKGKMENVASWSVVTGLKAPGKESKLVGAVASMLLRWGGLIGARRAERVGSGTGAEPWADSHDDVWNRVSVGTSLRMEAKVLGEHWWMVPAIALTAEDLHAALPDYEAPEGAAAGDAWGVLWRARAGKVVGKEFFDLVADVVTEMDLKGVWDLKPALTGNEAASLLGLKPGPGIRDALELLMKMQLSDPAASKEQLTQLLSKTWLGDAKPAVEAGDEADNEAKAQ